MVLEELPLPVLEAMDREGVASFSPHPHLYLLGLFGEGDSLRGVSLMIVIIIIIIITIIIIIVAILEEERDVRVRERSVSSSFFASFQHSCLLLPFSLLPLILLSVAVAVREVRSEALEVFDHRLFEVSEETPTILL